MAENGGPDRGWRLIEDPEFGVRVEEDGDVFFGCWSDLAHAFGDIAQCGGAVAARPHGTTSSDDRFLHLLEPSALIDGRRSP